MWLNFFKNKAQTNKAQKDHKKLRDSGKIAILLRYFYEDRILVRINLRDDPRDYATAVISVDKTSKTFELDEFTPEAGNAKLNRIKEIHFQGLARGITVNFNTALKFSDFSSNIALHTFHLPTTIEYLQRRSCFRAKASLGDPISISTYSTKTHKSIMGEVTDISIHGLGATINYNGPLVRGDQLTNCRLSLPNGEAVTVDLEIRQVRRLSRNEKTRIGCQYVDVDRPIRKRIEALVRRMERTQIRSQQKIRD